MMWYDHAREVQWHVNGHNNSASKFSGFEHLSTSFWGSPKCSIHFKLAVFFFNHIFFCFWSSLRVFFPASTVVFMVLKLFFWMSWKLLLSPKRSDADLSRPSDVQSCKVEGQSCVSCLKSSCFRVSIGKEIWDFDISFWYVTIQFITSYHFRTLLSSWWTVCLKFSSCEAEDAPRLPLQEIRQARTNRYE